MDKKYVKDRTGVILESPVAGAEKKKKKTTDSEKSRKTYG